jgi:dienelactone hydrolase
VAAAPAAAARADEPAIDRPPAAYADDLGAYRSPLLFDDGRPVRTAEDWALRRREILDTWHGLMGAWPPRLDPPRLERLGATEHDGFTRHAVRVGVAPERTMDGYLLVPEGDGTGPRPAVLVVFYEPETAVGAGRPLRDFGLQLARRGFVVLSLGVDPRPVIPDAAALGLQTLSYLAYAASNARAALAAQPEVDPARIGVVGHSYGGKWAMFAACLDDQFACGAWSDPGVAFDETRPNVNYWEPWYLGRDPDHERPPGVPTAENPRTGAYKVLVARGHDLHELQALMAPRPFLVSGGAEDPPERWRALNHVVAVNRLLGAEGRVLMTNRPQHEPNEESNEQIYQFFERVLTPGAGPGG